jgi:hypothetical protein
VAIVERRSIADQLRLLLPPPTDACEACGTIGEWAQLEDPAGLWLCGACHAGCPVAGCRPPGGLTAGEVDLWHRAAAIRARWGHVGGADARPDAVAAARDLVRRMESYERGEP